MTLLYRAFISTIFILWIAAVPARADDELTAQIGSTLMVGFGGKTASDSGVVQLCEQLAGGQVGGVIFYAHNIKTRAQTRALITHLKACGGLFQPIFAIDQEGGYVDRLGFTHFDGTRRRFLASRSGESGYSDQYQNMVQAVADLGFDVNFAPVADVNINPRNPIVGKLGRAHGTSAMDVTSRLPTLINTHVQAGLSTSLKHFPGHGSSTTDSHLGLTDITNSWRRTELEPFKLASQQPTTAVMVGHLVHHDLDPSGLPASLSPAITRDLLRGQLGFDGPVISDDMNMLAIQRYFGWEEASQLAMLAGIDMVILANGNAAKVLGYHRAVTALVIDGKLTVDELAAKGERLDKWVQRDYPVPSVRPAYTTSPDDT